MFPLMPRPTSYPNTRGSDRQRAGKSAGRHEFNQVPLFAPIVPPGGQTEHLRFFPFQECDLYPVQRVSNSLSGRFQPGLFPRPQIEECLRLEPGLQPMKCLRLPWREEPGHQLIEIVQPADLFDINADARIGSHRNERQILRMRQIEIKRFGQITRERRLAVWPKPELQCSRRTAKVSPKNRSQRAVADDESFAILIPEKSGSPVAFIL